MCASTARRHRGRHARRRSSRPRHSANSDGPDPDRLQPSAPASTAARLIARQARHERRPARLGDRVLERRARSARSRRGAARRRARRGSPTAGSASASGTVVPSSARAFAVSISRSGCTTTAVRPAGTGSRTTSGGFGRADEHEAAADRRRDVVGMRRAGAEPLAFERAGDQRLERRVRAEQRVDGDDRRGGARGAAAEAARQRQPLADASARRRAARRAPSAAPAPRRRPCSAPPRAAAARRRPMMSSMRDARPGASRAVTSSPGASSAKPSTSNPQATFDTVAGAKAVTSIRMRRSTRGGANAVTLDRHGCTGGGWSG